MTQIPILPHATDPAYGDFYKYTTPKVLLGTLALGAGGRLLKSIYDSITEKPRVTRGMSDIAEIPVDVSEEDAERLERRGFAVRSKLAEEVSATAAPAAEAAPAEQSKVIRGSPSALGALALGALGGIGTMGGWYLTDKVVDHYRRSARKSDINRIRDRIRKLLDSSPDEEDAPIYGAMKAAEDVYFSLPPDQMEKEAADGGLSWGDIPWMIAAGLGAGTAVHLVSGFKGSERKNPYRGQVSAIKDYYASRPTRKPIVSMVPVLSKRKEDRRDEEEEDEKEEISEIRVTGSPAQQASTNTVTATNWL